MDLLTAVAMSMLPVSRLRAAALAKELRLSGTTHTLEHVLDRCGVSSTSAEGRDAVVRCLESAALALAAAQSLGIVAIACGDDRYPALLACIDDPPPVLWARGALDCLTAPCVAIIGSRAASPYALQIAARLAAELADRGIVVASGLARGVDSAAHRGCLGAAGRTVAVTGSGLDVVYPRENAGLAQQIADKGLMLSELAPGAPPLAEHFPLRNRIISGISLAVVVVEASEKSGSLITAGCALRQGRDVMAVPGSVLSGRNRGSHALLKVGAKVVETADDILEDMGWNASETAPRTGLRATPGALSADPLLSKMDSGEVYRLDDLVEITGTTASKLLPRLMELELLGYIEAPGGGRFVRLTGLKTG
ncbi:MAG: DNA-processing protein DprA [Acidobacteriota bacterium]|nr:DNA-protecting protein DprA [Acidobacteriota bacterium]MDQ3418110.1 DNA-processing protein DprA [Acidobacteriota bacterium]